MNSMRDSTLFGHATLWNQLKEIFDYLPSGIKKEDLKDGNIIFNGDIAELNWE